MMTKREIIRLVLEGQRPPYLPWSCGFLTEARAKLQAYYGEVDLDAALGNHLLKLDSEIGFPDPLDRRFFADIPERITKYGDRFRIFQIGFSLEEEILNEYAR